MTEKLTSRYLSVQEIKKILNEKAKFELPELGEKEMARFQERLLNGKVGIPASHNFNPRFAGLNDAALEGKGLRRADKTKYLCLAYLHKDSINYEDMDNIISSIHT